MARGYLDPASIFQVEVSPSFAIWLLLQDCCLLKVIDYKSPFLKINDKAQCHRSHQVINKVLLLFYCVKERNDEGC